MRKVCGICKIEKPLSSYYQNRYWHNPDSKKRYTRSYCKDCFNKRYSENYKRYKMKFPGKTKARIKLNKAIKEGKIFKEPCKICNAIDKNEAHHPDYRKPLSVIWLCRKHHYDVHHKRIILKKCLNQTTKRR